MKQKASRNILRKLFLFFNSDEPQEVEERESKSLKIVLKVGVQDQADMAYTSSPYEDKKHKHKKKKKKKDKDKERHKYEVLYLITLNLY